MNRPIYRGCGAVKAPPKNSQLELIRRLAKELGIEVDDPPTQAEADFVIDDLRHLERQRKRARR